MSNEKNIPLTEAEAETIKKLVGVENLFVVLSKRTALPFVECDPETFDDQILVFDTPEYVQNTLMHMNK